MDKPTEKDQAASSSTNNKTVIKNENNDNNSNQHVNVDRRQHKASTGVRPSDDSGKENQKEDRRQSFTFMFNYWTENHTYYDLGVSTELVALLQQHGYFAQWVNPGVIGIYKD